MKQIVIAGLLGVALAGVAPAWAQDDTVTGTARAIDADILSFEPNQRVILWGVDAPDRDQFCELGNDTFACYEAAIRALETLASRGEVTCQLTGDPDPLRRRHGICTVDGVEINDEMVRKGYAFAYTQQSEDYTAAQEDAETAKVGLWQEDMEYELPWVARAKKGAGMR